MEGWTEWTWVEDHWEYEVCVSDENDTDVPFPNVSSDVHPHIAFSREDLP